MFRTRKLVCSLACALALCAAAQEPIVPVSPLAPPPPHTSPAKLATKLAAAQRAQDLGLPSVAVTLYREARDMPGADRAALTMTLVTALLDAGDAAEAEKLLKELPEPHGAAWHVRAGLAQFQLRNRDAAQAEWDVIVADDVPFDDKPWYWFLGGALYDTATPRDVRRANQFYSNAEMSASTELSKARFQLAGERVRLQMIGGAPSAADQARAFEGYQSNRGGVFEYESARYYAVVLAESGQREKAVTFLAGVIPDIPVQNHRARDDTRLALGVLGDRRRNGPGRTALVQLVETGQSPERQRQALQLLAAASEKDPERDEFLKLLSRLAAAKPDHPIKESILFFRAQTALADKNYVTAELDAEALLKQFPSSALKVHALGLMAQSSWEQGRYRLAGNYAGRARQELTNSAAAAAPAAGGRVPLFSGRARAELGVLEAEAYFRAGDYRSSADAYAAVLQERADLEPAKLGSLMFQRVLAEIRAGGDAAKVLDELARDPAFDVESRWQAEWHLARDLQTRGPAAIQRALARVTALLDQPAPPGTALDPELRARVAWLQARLALESGDAEQAVKRVDALVSAPLKIKSAENIAGMATLLKAQAEFALGREAAALETLKRLRETYAATEAAISSYLIESSYYAERENLDEARKTLVKLVDTYKNRDSGDYVPDALYRLALLSERLGGEQNLQEANRRIEDLAERELQAGRSLSPLMFRARLEQGHIYRKLNDFPTAQRAYEYLVNNYAQAPEVVYAQLALADCHNAQSASDRDTHLHADAAQLLFEQLRDRVDAPADVRVEAGYNLGLLLKRRGKPEEAAKVWWEIVDPLFRDEPVVFEHAAKRPYWLARTLKELGELMQELKRFEDAKHAFLLLLKSGLPNGDAIARVKLEQLGVPVPKTGQ